MEQNIADLAKIALINHPVEADVKVNYSDEDIIMIDNVRMLAEPSVTKLQMNLIAFCRKGKAQVNINGVPSLFKENQILVCPSQVVFSDFMLSPDFDFKSIFISNSKLQHFLREKMNVWTQLYINKVWVSSLEKEEVDFLLHFYNMINLCIHSRIEYANKSEVTQSLLRAGILAFCGLLETKMLVNVPVNEGRRSSNQLFQQFMNLLSNNTAKHQTVAYYADQLCISPKYLSAICKQSTGKTANEWIREHVMEDIRYYLQQTDLSIKEICDRLGFPNPSFFGKYVKEHFGMTPSKMRRG